MSGLRRAAASTAEYWLKSWEVLGRSEIRPWVKGAVFSIVVIAVLSVLAEDLRQLDWGTVREAVLAVSLPAILAAIAFTSLSYLAMALYDDVAMRVLGHDIPRSTSLRAGFAATAMGQTLGFGVFVGSAVRWRFYRNSGVSAAQAGLITGVVSAGFFLTLVMIVAASLLVGHYDFAAITGLEPWLLISLALLSLSFGAALLLLSYIQPALRLAGRDVAVPRWQPLCRIMVLAVLDVLPAAAALWMLLPSDVALDFWQILPIYAVALGLALASNTPGGLGVLEFACLLAWPHVPAESLIAALILYRCVFYGLPFLFAAALLMDWEWSPRASARPKARIQALKPVGAGYVPAPVLRLLKDSGRAEAGLALQGDKSFFLAASGRAALMYRDSGNARVALSDPIGPEEAWPQLLAEFAAASRSDMRKPAFYKCSDRAGPALRAAGFTLHKVSEEAIVSLSEDGFSGSKYRELRRKIRAAEKAGLRTEVHAPGRAPIARLRPIHDAWLAAKGGQERHFSIGRFEPIYLSNFHIIEAVLGEETVGFLSLWRSGDGAEWSVDIMQISEQAPNGTMHYLIAEGMEMARKEGAARFSLCAVPFQLGKAPETLFERWVEWYFKGQGKALGLVGLARFKSSFKPDWEPRYFAAEARQLPVQTALAVRSLIKRGR